jgi:serine protease Do
MRGLRLLLFISLIAGMGLGRAFADHDSPAETAQQDSKGQTSAPAEGPRENAAAGNEQPAEPETVEELAARVRDAVVEVSYTGRDGKQQGLGTGFIIAEEGLIATNFHVIGEARPITVRLADGKEHDVVAVHATERSMDLAVLRIDARNLPSLKLGDSDELREGQAVVAIGNPHGLKHSVVSGVVSGRREIEGRPMIQLAIPIEPGNSGGPLLDRQGRVHGLLTLKSLVTENLGFAITVNSLKPLLERPNPVPMSRWLTIGALDPKDWTPLFGARWRQRAGRIHVDGTGQGFGGRSLCLSNKDVPDLPYELTATVRLKQEDGAAGLVFHADGNHKHYGFYPSGGKLRLSRFDGPDVFSWQVLEEKPNPHYKPGEWNTLKVRLDENKIECFVNGHLVIESTDARFGSGQAGLAKFRNTEAEFRGFRVAREIPSTQPSDELTQRIRELAAALPTQRPPDRDAIEPLVSEASAAAALLREQSRELERRAERLRQLAAAVHQTKVRRKIAELLQQDEDKIDLLQAALLIAALDNDEVDVQAYLDEVDRLARDLKDTLPDDADEQAKLAALNKLLFAELGFHGSRTDYYHRSNSYLNEVIDDREGLPITLSVLYMEIARRIGLNVVGVGLPGHFVVRHEPAEGESRLIDVFENGAELTQEQAAAQVMRSAGRPLRDSDLATATKRVIAIRMLHNLMNVARDAADVEAMLRYVETIVAIQGAEAADERWFRAVLYFQTDRTAEALADTKWLLEARPEGIDLDRVSELQRVLEQRMRTDAGGM